MPRDNETNGEEPLPPKKRARDAPPPEAAPPVPPAPPKPSLPRSYSEVRSMSAHTDADEASGGTPADEEEGGGAELSDSEVRSPSYAPPAAAAPAPVAAAATAAVAAPPISVPAEDRIHLLPFLIPTSICDSDNPSIVELVRSLIPPPAVAGAPPLGMRERADRIRDWIRDNIRYTLDDKRAKASETLAKRGGMCTNKANLQIAMLRAARVPCGYRLVHITKECYRSDSMLPELFAKIHEPTVHCFAAVYLPDLSDDGAAAGDGGDDAPPPVPLRSGDFYNYDATEKRRAGGPDALTFLHETASERGVTGGGVVETAYKPRWLRGPMGPVQANLDHLLLMNPSHRWALAKNLVERQNELFRKSGESN